MKRVKVLVAAEADLSADRMEIVNFFRKLNDCYLDRGLYFSLTTPEDGLEDTGRDGSPDEFNVKLTDGDIIFFMFAAGTDHETFKSFEAALESHKKKNQPKIVVFIKADTIPNQLQEVERIKERLDHESDLYVNTYEHLDTVKLGLLMQIKQLDLDGVDIRLEDGRAWQGGEVLLSLDHVETVSGYVELQRLKSRRAELESRFFESRARYIENPDDKEGYEAFFEAANLRSEAVQEIRNIEMRLYHMIEGMYEQTSQGRLSHRQVEGYRLIERGRFQEAKAVLDFEAIISESRHDEALADMMDKRAQVHVNEQLQLVSVNKTLGDWDGVDACYREAVHLEERHNLSKKAMYAYADFLYDQNRATEGIAVAEQLRAYYQHEEGVTDVARGNLYDLLGMLYRDAHLIRESEEMHKASLETRQRLADQNNEVYARVLANSYFNLGRLYGEARRLSEAIEMNLAALEIRKQLSERHPEIGEVDLAASYNNIGVAYQLVQRRAEAEAMYKAAAEIRKRLVERDPETHEPRLATTYNNLGLLYCENNRMAEAEEMHMLALEMRTRMVGRNPGAYEPHLEMSYINLGVLYTSMHRLEEAETTHKLALSLQLKLAGRKRNTLQPDLLLTYNNLGSVYSETERWVEAEAMHRAALDLALKMTSVNAAAYEPDLANSYLYLGVAYLGAQRIPDAEQAFNEAKKLYEALVIRIPDAYEPKLAKNYYYLGLLYQRIHSMVQAEEMLRIAFEMCQNLVASNADTHEPLLADIYYALGDLLRETQQLSRAEEAYSNALQLYEKHAPLNAQNAREVAKTRSVIERLREMPASEVAGSVLALFTPLEREIALLLTEGETQRDIARRLKLTAVEVRRNVELIRRKVVGTRISDPVLAAIVHEFKLSHREEHILRCLRREMTNAEIAAELYIAEETVRYHIHKLLKKLPVQNRQSVATWVLTFETKDEASSRD